MTTVKNQSTQDTTGQQIPKDSTSNSESSREERGDNASLMANDVRDPSYHPTNLTQPTKQSVIHKTGTNVQHKTVIKSKLRLRPYTKVPSTLYFMCPGCREFHSIHTDREDINGARHILTGTLERPTVSSMISRQIEKFNTSKHAANHEYRCNSFILDGNIRFLENCTHSLAGKVVELPFVD